MLKRTIHLVQILLLLFIMFVWIVSLSDNGTQQNQPSTIINGVYGFLLFLWIATYVIQISYKKWFVNILCWAAFISFYLFLSLYGINSLNTYFY
ncbi:hypothetical protein [Shouchella patagoniensis]|uniref:hypothetical protein n=1 Tax=Shouchella patagoniensis TaxID=228576 RepID=UPI0009950730|nr:hypothetical protein [Shouchella patagoniensis]